MNPWPVDADVPEVHLPRPGHADLVGAQKYGLTDVRNVLERASARETAARVAGGALAKAFLRALGVEVARTSCRSATVPRPRAPTCALEDFAGVDESTRSAAWTPDASARDGRATSTRSARPTSRSAACSR